MNVIQGLRLQSEASIQEQASTLPLIPTEGEPLPRQACRHEG